MCETADLQGGQGSRRSELQTRAAEERRRRYPVLAEDVPPPNRPVMTERYGLVVFTDVAGKPVELPEDTQLYAHADAGSGDYVWAMWRRPALEEISATVPALETTGPAERQRGWWRPTRRELELAARQCSSAVRLGSRRS